MTLLPNRRVRGPLVLRLGAAGMLAVLLFPGLARAGKLAWLDEVVREVVRETEAGGKAIVRGGDGATAHAAGQLFTREADEGLEIVARRYEDLARAGRRLEQPSETLLQQRFARLMRHDPGAARAFTGLTSAEKRLVVEMGETAERLALRYPGQAEAMIRKLGTEGLSATRVFGDDVAEVIVKEGPESIGVLRTTGRGGWRFFTEKVLPNKGKLAAAGVLAAFLANPDKFVDYAGQATEYAVREFSKAGVQLAAAVTGGAARGLETSIARGLAAHGLDFAALRYVGMGLAVLVIVLASLVILGLPVRWVFRPLTWPLRLVLSRFRTPRTACHSHDPRFQDSLMD
jgi:hypothetical protein